MKQIPKLTEDDIAKMYADFYPQLVQILCNKFKISVDDAEDFTQEAFIRMLRSFRNNAFENKNFNSYMVTVTKNLFLDAERKLKQKKTVRINDIIAKHIYEPSLNAEDNIIKEELKDAVRRVIMRLPSDQQIVIKGFYYDQKSFKEIADILNKSINTILSMALYSRKKMLKLLTGKPVRTRSISGKN